VNNAENQHGPVRSERFISIKTEPALLKVMIVEEESVVAQQLCEEILNIGRDVIVAVSGSGSEAIEFAKRNPPHVVLINIDIKSDQINSVETAMMIQKITNVQIPVVFIVTYPPHDFPLNGTVDPYLYLKKPFSNDELRQVMQKVEQLRKTESS
jgi:DNA-binding LytR/AlgR family response regulator